MQLDEFVSQTLVQIISGVKAAQSEAAGQSASVNPPVDVGGSQDIEFDVAVTTEQNSKTSMGAGILVAGIGVGGKGQSGEGATSHHRIRFKVPVRLPTQGAAKEYVPHGMAVVRD